MALAEIDVNKAMRQGWRPRRGGWRCGDCDKMRDIEIVNDTLDRLRADRLTREEALAVQDTEAADFILGYTKEKRVVFVHCKGKGNGGGHGEYSASGLQDVCGQATKNLRYFSRFGSEVPPKAKYWHTRTWSGANSVSGQVTKRVRRGPAGSSGTDVWRHFQSIIRDPYGDLQVWLFLGRMLSKSKFGAQLTKSTPAAEAQQAAFLLFSTMNDVASVGGRLKVYCSP